MESVNQPSSEVPLQVVSVGDIAETSAPEVSAAMSASGLSLKDAKRRYSMDPDLWIVIEGEQVPARSQILMDASAVFREMLLIDDGSEQIELKGERRGEFDVLWSVLLHRSQLSVENVMFLTVWADKYQIEGLKGRCEIFLVKDMPVDEKNALDLSAWADQYQICGLKSRCEDVLISHAHVNCAALEHAIMYNLQRRAEQCVAEISENITQWIGELTSMNSKVSTTTLRTLWPSICKAAQVDAPMLDDLTPGHALWPFIANAVLTVSLAADVKSLADDAKSWPTGLYNLLTNPSDCKARDWLKAKLQTHQLTRS
jgi:hypothetical protein